jgi:signal transduction histidine kinase
MTMRLRLWPRTLVGQAALVVLLAVAGSNLVGLLVYSGDRLDLMASARGHDLAERIALAAQVLETVPAAERRQHLQTLRQPGLRLFWGRQPLTGGDGDGLQVRLVRRALLAELGDDWADRLQLASGPPPPPGWGRGLGRFADGDEGPHPGRPPGAGRGDGAGGGPLALPFDWGATAEPAFLGSLRLADGSYLNFVAAQAVFRPFWATPFFFVVVGTTLAVAAVSLWAVRKAAKPLSMFADAAERLGRDVDAPPLAAEGPLEVRRAAQAFNDMQNRLQVLLRNRLQMLAAMSHDLRTPITRLKLRAEMTDDAEQRAKTIADLDELLSMVDATLAYARDNAHLEAASAFDVAVLLQAVCEEREDAGGQARYEGPAHLSFVGRPRMLKRAFANLADNAVKYGGGAEIRLADPGDAIVVTVDDGGPGIPSAELGRVFEPFYRVDASRSRATGGVGLGLAVVRAAVEAHGGSVLLANRPEGGLTAVVRLPRSAPPSPDVGAPDLPAPALAPGMPTAAGRP